MRIIAAVFLTLVVASSWAANSSAIDGHYHYEQHVGTLPNVRVLGLKDLGATDASLDITASGTITLHMMMSLGKVVDQSAKLVSLQFVEGKGNWIDNLTYGNTSGTFGNPRIEAPQYVNTNSNPSFPYVPIWLQYTSVFTGTPQSLIYWNQIPN